MGKRIITLILTFFVLNYHSYSCDVCGGFTSGFSMLNSFKKNSTQVGYRHVRYNASSRLGYNTKDVFQLINFELNYRIRPRIIFNFTAPYLIKNRYANGDVLTKEGLGDIALVTKYVIVSDEMENKNNIYLEIGSGLKLRTGQYKNNIIDENLPKSFNLGNGSLGIPFNSRFIYTSKGKGIIARLNYQHNFETFAGHTFGGNYNGSFSFFNEIELKKSKTLIPQLSMIVEGQNKDQFPNDKRDNSSGGMIGFLSPGINLKTKSCLMGAAVQIPIKQQFNNKTLATKTQLNMQVSYLF